MKNGIIGFIVGALVSGVVVYAGNILSADKVSYNDTTVKDSIDNLFNESLDGKNSIIKSLSDNGLNLNDNSTYSEIITEIGSTFNDINNGKQLVAEAITTKGVKTLASDSFETMANNISNIVQKNAYLLSTNVTRGSSNTVTLEKEPSGFIIFIDKTANGRMAYYNISTKQIYTCDTSISGVSINGKKLTFTWGGSSLTYSMNIYYT